LKLYHKITEITGAPGSGKTFFIENNFPRRIVLLGGMPLTYSTAKRVMYSVLLSIYALATGSINFRQTWWLMRKAATYDETLFSRMNALRNSLTKFGYYFYSANNNSIVIDEGVSHIPFILGLSNMEVDCFIKLFFNHLKNKKIIFVQNPPVEILNKRLIARGHKRIRGVKDAEEFVGINIRIAEHYKKALSGSGLDVTFIQV